ncbi:hypothetical protein QE152_g12606 [Popillia japonica]|uniref:Uncharacterized protein n=1 Tax=Popillia japonica TaxID=7064 RepID=A0AAW1LRC2_POPJA
MIRTPPKKEALNKYNILSSPESPSSTPKPQRSNFGELDALSNEDILKHIKLLQFLLKKRSFSNNPRDLSMEFSFAPTDEAPVNSQSMEEDRYSFSSATRTERPTGRRRQASSPDRVVVEAQIHSEGQLLRNGTSSVLGDSPKSGYTPKRISLQAEQFTESQLSQLTQANGEEIIEVQNDDYSNEDQSQIAEVLSTPTMTRTTNIPKNSKKTPNPSKVVPPKSKKAKIESSLDSAVHALTQVC